MKWKTLVVMLLLILILGTVAVGVQLQTPLRTEVDTVALNELIHTAQANWPAVEEGDYESIAYPFAVLDASGSLLVESEKGLFTSREAAFRQRMPIADISVGNERVGEVIMYNDVQVGIRDIQQRLAGFTGIFGLAIALIAGIYLLLLYRTVIQPFQQLQSFARSIARGQLDTPLRMKRDNWFGAFTESFDLLREELATAKQGEYEANRSKKELVATLSHDIKTPIASIKAISELLLLRMTEEKTVKQISTIHAKADQINVLITDMFHATLEELSELRVKPVEAYSTVLEGMIADANIDERMSSDPIPRSMLRVDTVRLQQVLDNVISNSLKYAGTSIHVHSELMPDHLRLQIDDYGSGVPAEELPLLTNKYYRGQQAAGHSGAGLGLYISRYFMEQMGGALECKNREDGFSVILRIPLAS